MRAFPSSGSLVGSSFATTSTSAAMRLGVRAMRREGQIARTNTGLPLPTPASLHRIDARVFATDSTAGGSAGGGSEGGEKSQGKKSRAGKWKVLAGLVGVVGVGAYVVDLTLNDDWDTALDRFRSRLSEEERKKRPTLVILGAGWGALSMLRKLQTDKFNVIVISPRNYFLFTPLLPSTTTGELDARSIIEPIRHYCQRAGAIETEFVEAECISIDPVTQKVTCVDDSPVRGKVSKFDVNYDYLVVSVGADNATFNIPGVREHACFMKEVGDSQKIRNRIMDCVETAMIPGQPEEELERLLHFVVVGGGPSGVEFTADLFDFVKQDIHRHFPKLSKYIKITLVEALPHILNMFDANLISVVEQRFTTNPHIDIANNSAVTRVGETAITVKKRDTDETKDIPYGTLVWATGNAPRKVTSELIKALPKEAQPYERRGLAVDSFLRVQGTNNIWAIGDCTATNIPATAQAAGQEGRYLGRLFNRLADNMYSDAHSPAKEKLEEQLKKEIPFTYHHLGSLAYIGSQEAIADFKKKDQGGFTFSGFLTFFLWRSVYFSRLLSVRNRFNVALDWTKAAIFGRDISRV